MLDHLKLLTSDVACVHILTRDDGSNRTHQRDAEIDHIYDWLEHRQMNAVDDKCCTVYVSVSQMAGLNSGDSVHWGVWVQSLPESKGKGKGKYSAQVRSRVIICSRSRAQGKNSNILTCQQEIKLQRFCGRQNAADSCSKNNEIVIDD